MSSYNSNHDSNYISNYYNNNEYSSNPYSQNYYDNNVYSLYTNPNSKTITKDYNPQTQSVKSVTFDEKSISVSKKNSPTDRQKFIAGAMVSVIVGYYIYSYYNNIPATQPKDHISTIILLYAITIPFILRLSPEWYSYPMQLFTTFMIVILDWFSLNQDKSRFSEEELCVLGNCRMNARITGHGAHMADTLSLGLLIVPFIESTKYKLIVSLGFLVYYLSGVILVEKMTKDESESDLRGKTETEKCLQARIMKDTWRGAFNEIITFLDLLIAWQSFFACNNGSCDSSFFPFNQFLNLTKNIKSNSFKLMMLSLARFLIYDLGMILAPTFADYVNTSAQHGLISAKSFKLPDCFDDN